MMNAIYTRRSVRKFRDQAVEMEKIEQLLKAAMQAPSAGNQQPWEFLVIQGQERLSKLSEFAPYAKSLKNAGLSIIVMGNEERISKPLWQQDLSAATQNILLEAVDLGLGSVWLGTYPHEDRQAFIRDMFDLDQTLIPFAVLAIGYPEDDNANKLHDRYDKDRVRYIG